MFEITRSNQKVNGVEVHTWKAELLNANILEVEVGTTGYCGGDTGHGGRVYFSIRDLGSTDINVKVISNSYRDTEGVVIELGGDTELSTFIEALEFAVKVLKEQSQETE
jgi:hypothetical protein